MWSPDPRLRRAAFRGLRAALIAAAVAAVAGCVGGYRPLYGEASVGYATQDALARVEIAPVGERVGQQVRNELIRLFYPAGVAIDPIYRMSLQLSIYERDVFVRRSTEVNRKTVVLQASYRIEDPAVEAPPVAAGTALAETSYNRFTSEFANIRAQRDAENRAAVELAEQIRNQVAAALASGRV
jgi:LPS-assembly lipoprotein